MDPKPSRTNLFNRDDHHAPMKLTIVLEPQEEGGFAVFVPALPGCISQGETREEAIENIREAIALYLESGENENLEYPGEHITLTV